MLVVIPHSSASESSSELDHWLGLASPILKYLINNINNYSKMHKFWRCRLIFWWNQHQHFEIVLLESGYVGLTVGHALGRRPAGVPVNVTLHVLHLLQSWKTKIHLSIHGQVMGHYLAHRMIVKVIQNIPKKQERQTTMRPQNDPHCREYRLSMGR